MKHSELKINSLYHIPTAEEGDGDLEGCTGPYILLGFENADRQSDDRNILADVRDAKTGKKGCVYIKRIESEVSIHPVGTTVRIHSVKYGHHFDIGAIATVAHSPEYSQGPYRLESYDPEDGGSTNWLLHDDEFERFDLDAHSHIPVGTDVSLNWGGPFDAVVVGHKFMKYRHVDDTLYHMVRYEKDGRTFVRGHTLPSVTVKQAQPDPEPEARRTPSPVCVNCDDPEMKELVERFAAGIMQSLWAPTPAAFGLPSIRDLMAGVTPDDPGDAESELLYKLDHPETDESIIPNGDFILKDSGERAQFESGMVRDVATDKTDYSLVFDGPMFERWASLLTAGAKKYAARNWMKASGSEEMERFRQSAMRHFVQWFRGDTDEDHAAAVIFNINGAEYTKSRLA